MKFNPQLSRQFFVPRQRVARGWVRRDLPQRLKFKGRPASEEFGPSSDYVPAAHWIKPV
jgi:hypothetical protein